MEEYKKIILTGVIAFLVGASLKLLKRKSRIVWWNSHNFLFEMNDNLLIYTNAITIQNLGTKTAEKIQIAHKRAPEHFKVSPALHYVETTNPQGEHVIQIDSLAPNNNITIEFLSLINAPQTLNITSNDGQAKLITKVTYPLNRILIALALIFISLGTVIYWLIQFINMLIMHSPN